MLSSEVKYKAAAGGYPNRPGRIILTGYRATGKSLVGRRLAEEMGLEFIDTDTLLAEQMQCSLAEFVAGRGWEAFRRAEEKLLTELADRTDVVIATGGGAIMHQTAWQKLREGGLVVWLQAAPETIRDRLHGDSRSDSQRPSLTGSSVTEEVEEVMRKRQPFYERGSDLAVDTSNMSPEEIVVKIGRVLAGGET